jgi:hypothetical protein
MNSENFQPLIRKFLDAIKNNFAKNNTLKDQFSSLKYLVLTVVIVSVHLYLHYF